MIGDPTNSGSRSAPSFTTQPDQATPVEEAGNASIQMAVDAAQNSHQKDEPNETDAPGCSGRSSSSVVGGGTILIDPSTTLPISPRLYSSKLNNRLQSSLSALDKKGKMYSKFYAHDPNDPNIKRVLEAVAGDHTVATNPVDNKHRRTVVLNRNNEQSYGMALMSYVIRLPDGQMYRINYVDNVEIGSVAEIAGVRAGDIILSINGHSVLDEDHFGIVNILKQHTNIRLVLLFENCVHKIDLCSRAYKLKAMIEDKKLDLKMLEINEQRILNGERPLSHSDLLSSVLTMSDSFDSSSLSLDLGVDYESCGSCSDVPSSPETQRDPLPESWSITPNHEDLTTPSSEDQSTLQITRL